MAVEGGWEYADEQKQTYSANLDVPPAKKQR